MPKVGEFDHNYPNLLETENHIKLLEPFIGTKKHHSMLCMDCGYVWSATPLSKRQTYKKYGVSGCPECNLSRRDAKYKVHRQSHLDRLTDRGIEILDPKYDGRLRLDYTKTLKEEKILVRNNRCGHTFCVTPLNLLQSNVECGVCGPTKRITNATAWSKANSEEWKKTADIWQLYKSKVGKLSRKAYKENKDKINPNNFPTGRAGVEGAYHIDHIVPIRYCFIHYIPEELCAHPTNLQMLQWRDNIGSRDKLKEYIPEIFTGFITKINVTNFQFA